MQAIIKDKNKDEIEWIQKRNSWAKKLCWGGCMLYLILRKLKK